jgi:hypothetical protein
MHAIWLYVALAFGKSSIVHEGKTYCTEMQDLVSILGIRVSGSTDACGRELHYVTMQVRVSSAHGDRTVTLIGGQRKQVLGIVLEASEAGYEWGAEPTRATLRVDRR